jgi:hypothetical protein
MVTALRKFFRTVTAMLCVTLWGICSYPIWAKGPVDGWHVRTQLGVEGR